MALSRIVAAPLAAVALLTVAAPASAQRFTFDKTAPATSGASVDVSTLRGKIAITAGTGDQIEVHGTVTVRVGPNVPANAAALAKQAAANPSFDTAGGTIRLRPPTDDETRRAVTVSYEIRMPARVGVLAVSDSGAISVTGVNGTVSVKTTSGAITLARLEGQTDVSTGSGAVLVTGAGGLKVQTASSGIDLHDLRGDLRVTTQSGRVSGLFVGNGDVDIETGSGEIRLQRVNGGITAKTGSGRVTIAGNPIKPWTVTTTSGSIRAGLRSSAVTLDATTGSGSVVAQGLQVKGTNEKKHIAGSVASGGPLVRLTSRSGSITVVRVFE